MSDIIKNQIDAYRPNFLKFGDTPKGTFQNNTETQYLRFHRLLLNLNMAAHPNFSILDVGAGMCDLHQYLEMHKIAHRYTGFEIVPEMVSEAKKKYPSIEVTSTDILSLDGTPTYDFVVLSGTFNIPGGVAQPEWKEFCFQMVQKMFGVSKFGIAFNFLSTVSTFTDPSLFYLNPSEVLAFCQSRLSRFAHVDSNYPLYETTVSVWKKDYVRQGYTEAAFDKYFKN